MEVLEIQAKGLKREFKVTVPVAEITGRVDAKLKEISATANLPGFRKGHVPLSLLRGKYGKQLLSEVVQRATAEAVQGLLKDRNLRPAAQPHVAISAFPDGKDLEFTLALELIPEIDFMDFTKIEIERLEPVINEKVVEEAMANAAAGQRRHGPLSKARPAAMGDLVTIDFLGRLGDVPFDGGTAENQQLELGGGQFIPGFEEQLVGVKAGDSLTVTLNFPDTYPAENLAGKEANFDVTVKEIQERIPFAVDDDLAKAFGLENLDQLRTQMKENLEQEYKNVSAVREKREYLGILAEGHDFDLPQGVVEAEFEAVWEQVQGRREQQKLAKEQGATDEDEFEGKDDATLKEEYRDVAERRVRLGLLLSEIGAKYDVSLTQEEINEGVQAEARHHPGQEQQVFEYFQKNPDALQRLIAPVFEKKMVGFLVEMAKITTRKVAPDELMNAVQATMEQAIGKTEKKTATPKKKAAKAVKSKKDADKPAKSAKPAKAAKAAKAKKKETAEKPKKKAAAKAKK